MNLYRMEKGNLRPTRCVYVSREREKKGHLSSRHCSGCQRDAPRVLGKSKSHKNMLRYCQSCLNFPRQTESQTDTGAAENDTRHTSLRSSTLVSPFCGGLFVMANELVLERPPLLLRRGTSIEEKDLDPWTAWAYRPRTLTFLLLGACLLVWASGALDPDASSQHDSATNVYRGIWAMIAVFLGYCLLQAPPTILIRPHPSVWRLVHGIAVVYLVFLSFILFQARDDARQFMKLLHKDLGVELPEKSYGSDCRLYTPENTESSLTSYELVCHGFQKG
ncbi:hypothetical protein L7F22_042838 [Adiantum nelumboides]|nr:hypothetical protein [Adiantum nelumboides]